MYNTKKNLISRFKRKKHFRQVRAQLRGARKLREDGRSFFVADTVSELVDVQLDLDKHCLNKAMSDSHGIEPDIFIRQILYQNRKKICTDIMRFMGTRKAIKSPLPDAWINHLESRGIRCDKIGCKIALYKFASLSLLRGIFNFIILSIQHKLVAYSGKPYVAFIGLNQNKLPSVNKKSYDIISWYKNCSLEKPFFQEIWIQFTGKSSLLTPNDLIICNRFVFPKLRNSYDLFWYLIRGLKDVFIAIIGLLIGRYWNGLLFNELIQANYISELPKKYIAREYIFHSTQHYRPLWSYEVEKRGSFVSFYYYSTNIGDSFQNKDLIPSDQWRKLMRWNRIYVWDSYQKNYIKKFAKNADYLIGNILDWSDCPTQLPNFKSGIKVAVFDVMPRRLLFYTTLGYADYPYYSELLCVNFLSDIAKATENHNIHLSYKKKRDIPDRLNTKSYHKKINFITSKYYTSIASGISARRVIEDSDAVISMPYTSTAVIGKKLGKPSIYYDATGNGLLNESHGIPIIKTYEELKNWIKLFSDHNLSKHERHERQFKY